MKSRGLILLSALSSALLDHFPAFGHNLRGERKVVRRIWYELVRCVWIKAPPTVTVDSLYDDPMLRTWLLVSQALRNEEKLWQIRGAKCVRLCY